MGEKSVQKKRYILETARKVFVDKGFKRVTMKDIVEACDISRGGLYLYFDSTSQIFLEVIKMESEEADDVFSGKITEDATAADILILFLQEQKKELAALFGTDSFEKFRLELYSDQYDAKCHSSPRELMRATYRRAQSYAQCFPAEGQSLLFSGATGLGKTYLSACIARVVADRGFSVCYAPVGQLFSAFEDDKFRPRPDISRTEAFFISDLLVLDDLGTEMTTQFTISVLYQLLNTRLMEKKPVILSTNLAPSELAARYTPQITSRLLGTYCLFQFYGDDIRFKLK